MPDDPPALALLRQALHGTLLGMPYNSAAEFHRSFGASGACDPRFGAACVRQSLDVAERAEALGVDDCVLLQDDRHVAAVFQMDGDVVVLDPYLLHTEPIRFPAGEVAEGLSEVEVSAIPIRVDELGRSRPAKLQARYRSRSTGGYVIRLGYSRYGPVRGGYTLARHFSIRSSSPLDQATFTGDLRRQLTHPEQTSLSVRAVTVDGTGTAELILPLRVDGNAASKGENLWTRSRQGTVARWGSEPAKAVLDELTAATGASEQELAEHLLDAASIYRQITDPLHQVAEYSLADE